MRFIIRRNGILFVISALISSVQNCIAILTRPTVYKDYYILYFILTIGRRPLETFQFFCYFYRFLIFFFLLSWTWIEGCPSGDLQLHLFPFFLLFFLQIHSHIRPFPLLSTTICFVLLSFEEMVPLY